MIGLLIENMLITETSLLPKVKGSLEEKCLLGILSDTRVCCVDITVIDNDNISV